MHALVADCGERWAPPCRENSHADGLLRNACSLEHPTIEFNALNLT